jgi:DNA-binding beta-propeller fold protein YncE
MFPFRNGLRKICLSSFISIQRTRPTDFCALVAAAVLIVALAPGVRAQTSATFGEVIALGATPGDIVLDESRQRLYLVNTSNTRVDVYDYAGKSMLGSISVGQSPLGAAMSMDNTTLYVANHDSSNLSVINLNSGSFGAVVNTIALPAKPQGVAVGADGRAVICTDGSGTSSTSNTLLVFDSLQAVSNQLLQVPFPPAPATPPALAPTTARITTQFNGKLLRTPDGLHIVGVSSITNNTSTVVYVYEPVSGTILASRTVTGQSSVLSMSPDGKRFMAGFTMYDIGTLNVIAQQSTATAPFPMSSAFSTTFNVGGSVFSPDGTTMYSAFNTAALTTPPPAPQAATLLISDPHSLAIQLGINLPESIMAKMVITQSGSDLWALSASGVTHLPLSTLYNYPILMPASTTVLLRQDDCNPGVAQGTVAINNIGGGNLTFAVPSTISGGSAALAATTTSGVAPSTITFTMDPGRSGVIRTPGTNLYTGAGATNTGAAVNLQLVSREAINVPPTIRVFMNYRDSTMSGIVHPVPTAVNSTAATYQGLNSVVLDETRNKVYISNPGYNRIEVFDTQKQEFVAPIPVGPLPHQMAMGLDGSTLYVANTGGESIQMVDLDAQQVTGSVQFPPIPMAGNANVVFPTGIGVTLSGLEIVMSNGNLWEVINGIAIPRTPTTVTGVASSGAQTPIATPPSMSAAPDGSKMILLGGTGTAYIYDGLTDAYTASQKLFGSSTATPGFGGIGTAIIGYYGPLGVAGQGSFMLANGLVLNSALTPIGGAASPGQVSITPPAGPGMPPSIGVTSTGLRNIAAVAPVGSTKFLRMSTPVRNSLTSATSDDPHTTLEAVDVTTGQTALAARMPENPVLSEFGTTRVAMPSQQMAVGSDGTVYTLTVSGLSVVPLTVAGPNSQPQIAATGGVMNADGTSTFQPGSFIVVNGTNLASTAAADTLPPPTVLGGSCVLFDEVAVPLLTASPTQLGAQIPAGIRPGINVVEVRSLATAQRSTPVVVTVQKP